MCDFKELADAIRAANGELPVPSRWQKFKKLWCYKKVAKQRAQNFFWAPLKIWADAIRAANGELPVPSRWQKFKKLRCYKEAAKQRAQNFFWAPLKIWEWLTSPRHR